MIERIGERCSGRCRMSMIFASLGCDQFVSIVLFIELEGYNMLGRGGVGRAKALG
jgi:hypothetical protein